MELSIIMSENEGQCIYKRWEYHDGKPYIKGKEICPVCNKPRLDINGVTDCDFCLQGLTTCDFIDNACCGHNHPDLAYISLKDGRRFVLDKMNW
jgi:hypothetical protein